MAFAYLIYIFSLFSPSYLFHVSLPRSASHSWLKWMTNKACFPPTAFNHVLHPEKSIFTGKSFTQFAALIISLGYGLRFSSCATHSWHHAVKLIRLDVVEVGRYRFFDDWRRNVNIWFDSKNINKKCFVILMYLLLLCINFYRVRHQGEIYFFFYSLRVIHFLFTSSHAAVSTAPSRTHCILCRNSFEIDRMTSSIPFDMR